MKKTLMFSQTNTGGTAATIAMSLISEDGQVKNQAQWTAPKNMAITRLIPIGATGNYSTLSRSSHAADNIVFVHPADTLADQDKNINIIDYLGGKGIEVLANESITMTSTISNSGTTSVLIELDDSVGAVNARMVRAAGANAAVALTPVESGANIVTGLNPNAKYRMRAFWATSTTIQHVMVKLNNNCIAMPGKNAILTGQGHTKLSDDQAAAMTGTGAEFTSGFSAWITCVTTDAANVQVFNILFESS